MAKVFDSSAVLAVLYEEPGAGNARRDLPGGMMSSVNAAEVLTVLVRRGMPLNEAATALRKTLLQVLAFSLDSAVKTASLSSPQMRDRGISLGDRACMATALLRGLPVVTADHNWIDLEISELKIELIRN